MGNFYNSYTACNVGDAGLHSCGILFLTVFFSGKALLKRRELVWLVFCFFFFFLADLVCVLSPLS